MHVFIVGEENNAATGNFDESATAPIGWNLQITLLNTASTTVFPNSSNLIIIGNWVRRKAIIEARNESDSSMWTNWLYSAFLILKLFLNNFCLIVK